MGKYLLALLALVVSSSFADTTSNQITSGTTHTWTGVNTGAHPGSCCSGGPGALYDPTTNIIHFSYGNATATQTFAINQALANAGAGIQVTGYNYSWDIQNNSQNGPDNLAVSVLTYNYNNTSIRRTDTWNYTSAFDWTTFSGTVNYVNPGAPSDFGNMVVKFTGMDRGYWAGYYGPKVRNVNLGMNYSVTDVCTTNPLSSTSCAGYQQAYTDQQCASNPLYSPQCAGYAAAYQAQQCSVNSLYSPACPGYATAYMSQQCSINSLYSTTCPGYQAAYFSQQCSVNPLFSVNCTGYAAAYKNQQCTANPLYATDCPGYDQAYLNSKCIVDSLYSRQCTGYATAYAIKYLVPVENSGAVNQVLSNNAAAMAAPPVPAPVPTAVEQATTTPSTTSATSQTSVTSVVAPPPPPSSPTSPVAQAQAQQPPPPPPPAGGDVKPSGPPTARQALAERRQEAAKAEAIEKGKNLAKTMGNVKSMEDQLATQDLVVGAMGYNPNFSAYQKSFVPDTVFYRPFTVYNNQKNIDNRRAQRIFGGSEVKHQEMVDSQYKKEE